MSGLSARLKLLLRRQMFLERRENALNVFCTFILKRHPLQEKKRKRKATLSHVRVHSEDKNMFRQINIKELKVWGFVLGRRFSRKCAKRNRFQEEGLRIKANSKGTEWSDLLLFEERATRIFASSVECSVIRERNFLEIIKNIDLWFIKYL